MNGVLAIVLKLLIIHEPGQHREIMVNPSAVTSLHPTKNKDDEDRLMTEETGCVVMMNDGKFISAIEKCAEIKKQLEETER
jgi:hypothetical protein